MATSSSRGPQHISSKSISPSRRPSAANTTFSRNRSPCSTLQRRHGGSERIGRGSTRGSAQLRRKRHEGMSLHRKRTAEAEQRTAEQRQSHTDTSTTVSKATAGQAVASVPVPTGSFCADSCERGTLSARPGSCASVTVTSSLLEERLHLRHAHLSSQQANERTERTRAGE